MPNYLKHQSQIAQSNAGFIWPQRQKTSPCCQKIRSFQIGWRRLCRKWGRGSKHGRRWSQVCILSNFIEHQENKYLLTFLAAANKSKEKKKKKKSDKLAKCPHCFRSIYHLKLVFEDRKDIYLRITSVSDRKMHWTVSKCCEYLLFLLVWGFLNTILRLQMYSLKPFTTLPTQNPFFFIQENLLNICQSRFICYTQNMF